MKIIQCTLLSIFLQSTVPLFAEASLPPEVARLEQGSANKRHKGEIAIWFNLKNWFPQGIEHILSGYDHLAFVIALALVLRSVMSLVKVITFFTLAHALTLTLAGLNIIHLGTTGISIIEMGIALSVAWVGLDTLYLVKNETSKLAGVLLKWRSLMAFSFGLVHGMGFAEKFRDETLGLDFSQFSAVLKFLVQILFFNLGVDTGQLLVAFSVFYLLKLVAKGGSEEFSRKVHNKVVFYCSLTIGVFGIIKLLESASKLLN